MIKYIFFILISVVIITTNGNWELPICNIQTAKQAIAPRIFAEQTVDGRDQPIIFTRFIHNKFGIFGSEFTRCYFFSLDPNFIYHSTGIGVIFWLYFLYMILTKKLYIPLAVFLIVPALPFFNLPVVIVAYSHKIFAIIGLLFLLSRKK